MKIAVDFDGTIVRHAYPKIGKENPFAFVTLRKLQQKHQLILWTVREDYLLQEAIEYCRANGVVFYAVNGNDPEEKNGTSYSRKVNADIFIDDRNIGGLPDWGLIYRMIEENVTMEEVLSQEYSAKKMSVIQRWIRKVF